MVKILILNGPGLPATPSDDITTSAKDAGAEIEWVQSDKLDKLFARMTSPNADAIIFNPAADITASSGLYRRAVDAMTKSAVPLTEVHLTNIYAAKHVPHSDRESAVTTGIICGLGDLGYVLAIKAIAENLGA